MEELLAVTGYKPKGFRRGQTVEGKVIEVTGRTVYVDIGGKAEAVVSEQEFELAKEYFRNLQPGDNVVGVVLVSENDSGQVILSLRNSFGFPFLKNMALNFPLPKAQNFP